MNRITAVFVVLASVNYADSYVGLDKAGDLAVENFIYEASIQHIDHGHLCNGAIVGKNYILTSAQCVKQFETQPFDLKVIYSSGRLNEGGSTVTVEKINIHPIFEEKIVKNDLALLQTSELQFTENVSGKLNFPTQENTFDRVFISSGWNATETNSTLLHRSETKPITFRECMQSSPELSHIIRPWLICSMDSAHPAKICRGQSASLLVLDDILYGIGTMNDETCAKTTFDLYTNVFRQIHWIQFIIEGYPRP